jgi:hypothetical protein
MNRRAIFLRFVIVFCSGFAGFLAASYLYNFIRHGTGVANWQLSLRLAFVLGVTLPVLQLLGKGMQHK